jgi:hypothetical protein
MKASVPIICADHFTVLEQSHDTARQKVGYGGFKIQGSCNSSQIASAVLHAYATDRTFARRK